MLAPRTIKDLSQSERRSWKSWLWAVLCLSGRATVAGFCPTILKVVIRSPQECLGWLGWTSRPFGGSFRMRSTPPKCWLSWQILAWTRSCFWACVWSSWWRSTWFIHSAHLCFQPAWCGNWQNSHSKLDQGYMHLGVKHASPGVGNTSSWHSMDCCPFCMVGPQKIERSYSWNCISAHMYWLHVSAPVYVCIIYFSYIHEYKGQHIFVALSHFFWLLAAANCCKVLKHHRTRPGMVPATPIVRWEWGQLAWPKCEWWVGRFGRGACAASQVRDSCSGLVSHWAFFHWSLLIVWVLGFDLCAPMSHHESSMAKCSLVMPSYDIDWMLWSSEFGDFIN